MKKQRIYINWKCPHCEHRNKALMKMEFDMPRYYFATWECDHCGKDSKLEWTLTVDGWPGERKKPKLRKRKKEKKETNKKTKDERDFSTKKDRAYINDHGSNKK